ncbi:hypothetical protein GQ600_20043 [Phytophthora cactorum]|nr:hypothetical protein GQ600_20043 [Phytophthora cactorum]
MVSPDSAVTYIITIKAGRVTHKVLEEVNLLLVPNRAERKATPAAHPVECARNILRVMKTVIETLLGWGQQARAPRRGGGLFGVVRAFGAAAEAQLAGDLHVHTAVWLHGFPPISDNYRDTIQTNASFRSRVISLVDCVLCTKPPCLEGKRRCPCCSTDDVPEPVTPGIDAFRRPAPGATPPTTPFCSICG